MARISRVLLAVALVQCVALASYAATLTIQIQGTGTTNPAAGSHSYSWASTATVYAYAGPGYIFDHWENAATGMKNPVKISMTSNKTLKAVFVPWSAANALRGYVNTYDSNYSWNQYHSVTSFGYTTYFIKFTSQRWRTTAEVDRDLWWHHLTITKGWFTGSKAVMVISGGNNNASDPTSPDETMGLMSLLTGIPVIELRQIPNQPLTFADEPGVVRNEDDIIAYSFDKAMVTGDLTWAAYMPMVKAVVRGMDTAQNKISGISQFILAGASKRGWTTWLTAAYDDPRILGFAPMVIDILNIDTQIDHHWDSYGFYAPALTPYVEFDLFCRMKAPEAYSLMRIIDPYLYVGATSAYSKPKLMIGSSGDQFFMPDAMQYYLSSLGGTNHVRYVPNTDHTLEQNDSVINGMAAWATNVKNGNANPGYSWTIQADRSIRVVATTAPSSVKLWQATNPNARDFRLESVGPIWTSTTLTDQGGGVYIGSVPPPAQGWSAYFVELTYPDDHVYSTQIVVNPDVEPFDGTHCM